MEKIKKGIGDSEIDLYGKLTIFINSIVRNPLVILNIGVIITIV